MDSIFDERACSVELQAFLLGIASISKWRSIAMLFLYRNVRNGYAENAKKYKDCCFFIKKCAGRW
jgi:hypothetical protein